MPWHYYTTTLEGRRVGVQLDDSFAASPPSEALPNLGWFGVYCRLDPGSAYWHPDETPELDAIEGNLIRLCELVGSGYAVYVRRLDTHGIREYYIYFGASADLAGVLPRLQLLHPGYRLEYEAQADPGWGHYRRWLREERGA